MARGCNVGGADRIIRIVAGIVLIGAGFLVPMGTLWQTIVFIVGTIALVTGLIRFCPVNALLGINTCPAGGKEKGPGAAQ